jgi:multiple sugar transport system permease protein
MAQWALGQSGAAVRADLRGKRARATTRPGARARSMRETAVGWSFVLPASIIVLGLSLFPAGWALVLSLEKWNGFTPATFVGLKNYQTLFADPDMWGAVVHTALYTVLFVPLSIFMGLFLAVALNRKIRFVGIYRTAIFVPFVASAASTGILATYLFSPQFGLVNNVLRVLGLPPQGWLENQHQAMFVIALMSLWGSAAFVTVIYLAALQDVPGELLESARIDGANRWQAFWYVIWPQLAPVTAFAFIWQTIDAIQLFDLVYTTTKGGPLDSTKTVVYFLWEQAFQVGQFGYGSAVAYVLFFVTLIITIGVVVYSRYARVEAF